MKWHSETFGDWNKRMSKWHNWFAWYPVFCLQERKTIWLNTVSRRLIQYFSYTGTAQWKYKEIIK